MKIFLCSAKYDNILHNIFPSIQIIIVILGDDMEQFKYVEDLFSELSITPPNLNFYSGDPQTFSLLRLQCSGELEHSENSGFIIKNHGSDELYKDFIRKAKSENPDIILTPEYSFPFRVLKEIIENKWYPNHGQLWCLGCEGIQLDYFYELMKTFEDSGVMVLNHALDLANLKVFINALIYVFVNENDTLFILPQLKTTAASDRDSCCEEFGMSKGNVIYKFGKNQCNQLCSIICSDALNKGLLTVNNIVSGNENVILLHPQLNPEPRHGTFRSLRRNLYEASQCNNLIYITANWAAGTISKHVETKTEIKFNIPWSCIYTKNKSKEWPEEHSIRQRNYLIGLSFGFINNCKLRVWYSIKTENVQLIQIKKPRITTACAKEIKNDVIGSKLFVKDGLRWVENEYDYENKDDLMHLIDNRSEEYMYPFHACKENRDKFFGICLGHFEAGQLLIDDNEICNIISQHVDEECEECRHTLIDNYKRLIYYLSEKKLPKCFNELVEKHKFCLADNIFNLQNEETDNKAMVVYIPNQREAIRVTEILYEIVKSYKDKIILHLLDQDEDKDIIRHYNKQRMLCVFSQDTNSGNVICYPESNPSITDGDQMLNNTSIMR